jgi:hypothetical protein
VLIPAYTQLQNERLADEMLLPWTVRKHREVVDVASLAPLVRGTEFLGNEFAFMKAWQCGRLELKVREVGLRELRQESGLEYRHLA